MAGAHPYLWAGLVADGVSVALGVGSFVLEQPPTVRARVMGPGSELSTLLVRFPRQRFRITAICNFHACRTMVVALCKRFQFARFLRKNCEEVLAPMGVFVSG